ncbi:MAG: hypothetical protein PHZ26_00865 [Candidatus Gracilibacteria bacterium]|nr:hypothetical protein [Candidatus Gracilibacteria bacterium]MDD2908286.1 hypothetical protein [Candidatus Gracilibacteria bacterium]
MKKISIIFLMVFLVVFAIISWRDIFYYVLINKANSEFNNKNYAKAFEEYKKINTEELTTQNKDIINFNKGNLYLKEGTRLLKLNNFTGALNNYKESLAYLGKIKSTGNDINFYKYNIAGDTYYLSGSGYLNNNNDKITIDNRDKSLINYQKAINTDTKINKENTIKNYEFVKKELEKLKKKQKDNSEKNGGEKNTETGSGNENTENTETGSGEQNSSQKEKIGEIGGKKWTNSGQFNSVGNTGQNGNNKATQDELNELKTYSESLKQFQKDNSKFLQRGKPETNKDIFDKMMNNFSQDPFFKDILPGGGQEKDW